MMKGRHVIRGRVWILGDNVNTDVILPGRFVYSTDQEAIRSHLFEGVDPTLSSRLKAGDIIVGGKNFGCGSARSAAGAMRRAGIACVVAKSFGRVFFRNAIDSGLPVLECDAEEAVKPEEEVEVDLDEALVTVVRSGRTMQGRPMAGFILDILDAGGVIPYTRNKLHGKELAR
jgi:3-isopropylmalate dehydratase small subunit